MTFDEAFERVIGHEGGYQDNPADRGNYTGGAINAGELKGTKFGISAAAYPGEDIRNMTLERAREIYKRDYWGPAGCDAVPGALRFDLFDMAVHSGVKAAIKALQRAVGEVEDGILGARTLQAISTLSTAQLLYRMTAARLVALTQVSDRAWSEFGRGWVRRVASNMTRSVA